MVSQLWRVYWTEAGRNAERDCPTYEAALALKAELKAAGIVARVIAIRTVVQ